MWNLIRKLNDDSFLNRAIVIMAVVATITFMGHIITSKEWSETCAKRQQITTMNNDIRNTMIKAHDEGMKYK